MKYTQRYNCTCGGRTNCPGVPCELCKNRRDGRGANPAKASERLMADIQEVEPSFLEADGPMEPTYQQIEIYMPVYLPGVRFTVHYTNGPDGPKVIRRFLDNAEVRKLIVDTINEWDKEHPALVQTLKDAIGGGS